MVPQSILIFFMHKYLQLRLCFVWQILLTLHLNSYPTYLPDFYQEQIGMPFLLRFRLTCLTICFLTAGCMPLCLLHWYICLRNLMIYFNTKIQYSNRTSSNSNRAVSHLFTLLLTILSLLRGILLNENAL